MAKSDLLLRKQMSKKGYRFTHLQYYISLLLMQVDDLR